MPLSRRVALVGMVGAAVPVAAQPRVGEAARTLTMLNTVYPPFVNPPDHPLGEGMDVELAREALRRAGYGMRVELVPWRRVLLLLRHGQGDFTTTISRREDRSDYLHWSPAYRLGANYRLYGRSGAPLEIHALSDLAGRRIGVIEGFHYPPVLLRQPGSVMVPGRDIGSLVAMLMAERTDVMLVTAIAGAWEIRQRGLDARVQRQPYEYTSDSPNYLAFAKARVDAKVVQQVGRALVQLQRDGTQARIEARYRL
ncbi:MAG: substrate-binding periplasmic protein [Inhella sp.]|uniref:substrate-binding periplasmic protein n=1 Tax=Inhella sp. TaxID=1921806 RepID=UPI00391F7E19